MYLRQLMPMLYLNHLLNTAAMTLCLEDSISDEYHGNGHS